MPHHLWQHNAPQHQAGRQRIGQTRFGLALGYGQNRAAESFRQVGAEDEANRQHTSPKRRYVDVAPALRIGQCIEANLAAIEN